MYKPDSHFMDKLHALDPKLGCEFNRNTEKFNITYQRVMGDPVPIVQVSSDTGGYRQPDHRELLILGEGDQAKGKNPKERLQQTAKYFDDYREKKQKDARDNIRHMTLENRRQLTNAVGKLGGGKFNSTFRRITPKSKGKVFK